MKHIKTKKTIGLLLISSLASMTSLVMAAESNVVNLVNKEVLAKKVTHTWNVDSSDEIKINVAKIGPKSITALNKNYSLVLANANSNATDMGAYHSLYLVFDSLTEAPHHQAVFNLGKTHSIQSAKMLDDTTIEVIVNLHSKSHRISTNEMTKKLTIDFSKVKTLIKNKPAKGNLSVSVKVKIS